MKEYMERIRGKVNGLKIKGKKMKNQGIKRHCAKKLKRKDHTHDYGKKSRKINEKIAKRLRKNEKEEYSRDVFTSDEYEEIIELERLKEQALEESKILPLTKEGIENTVNNVDYMEQAEKETLLKLQQIRLQKVKEKLKLISNGINVDILFDEWKALKEQILRHRINNIGGLIGWKEYRYGAYDDYEELEEYVIRLQNQLLHIYEYRDKIQVKLEEISEERKFSLERKAQKDSDESELIGWKKILGNQYSLEESFSIYAILECTQDISTGLSYFERVLEDTIKDPKMGKGTIETAKIILEDMQDSQEERE